MNYFNPNDPNFVYYLLAITAWSLPWKGVALWKAAKNKDKGWFVALLIFNTLAVLDILYIFVFSRETKKKNPVN